MKEMPILFAGPMIRALLDGQKTQTRRLLDPQPSHHVDAIEPHETYRNEFIPWKHGERSVSIVTRWEPCDLLWVRERVRAEELADGTDGVRYLADDAWRLIENTKQASDRWLALHRYRGKRGAAVNSIHMPRWASRITLEVTDVRVERLQDINEDEAIAEGAFKGKATGRVFNNITQMRVGGPEWRNARDWYADLWDTINGPGSWDKNPWVVALTFRRVGDGH